MAKLDRTMVVDASIPVNSKTPQVNALTSILTLATADSDGQITESQLRDHLQTDVARELLHTRQDPWLIFSYYRRQLVDAGFLTIDGLRQHQSVVRRPLGWEYEAQKPLGWEYDC